MSYILKNNTKIEGIYISIKIEIDNKIFQISTDNLKLIDKILELYLIKTKESYLLKKKYNISIVKNEKNFMKITSFDDHKLEKLLKMISYKFVV